MRLKNKVAIVTGGASGIGQATCCLFAEEGAMVVVADIDGEGAEKTAKSIREKGGKAIVIVSDISKEEHAARIAAEATRAFGRIDILVNNAATFVLKGIEAEIDEWRQSVGVNIIGTAMVTKYVLEEMKRTGGGSIVIIGSISSFIAQPNFAVYSATKAALVQMTRNFALDFSQFNVRVNCVCPGVTLTPASYRHMEQAKMTLDEFQSEFGKATMLKRVADPREIAYAILFLASDEASYITGTYLMVDGGYVAL